MTTSKKAIIETIRDYFYDNENEFIEAIEELDSYNGYLNDDRLYDMGSFSDLFCDRDAFEMFELGRLSGNDFNPSDDFFYFDVYGSLISLESYERFNHYEAYLDTYFVESLIDNCHNCGGYIYNSLSVEVQELIDKYEEIEE